jgi:hypothetical protein
MKVTRKDFLFVYDIELHRLMKSKGIEFITSAISNQDRKFWLYFRSPEVIETLEEYIQSKVN